MNILNRLSALLVVMSVAFGVLGTPASANSKFSAVTIDARTGAILYDSDSNALRHPASLTKMMTLYLVFQDLKAGRIKLSTPMRVSARASRMPPSKLGLKPGSTITVEQAIKALIVKSANDVAATVGENLGGSESAFAGRMTKVARSIGMSRTTFRNASGLPNPSQVTTARDMATLGLRLMRDYPQYYPYFRSTTFTFKGRVVRGHNRLVGRFAGTDGIKTGYINASGFNLVTSTRRGDKRLVGVVLGGKTAGRRDAYMMSMLSKAFPKARDGRTVAAVAGSSKGIVDPINKLKSSKQSKSTVEPEGSSGPDALEKAELAAVAADAAKVSGAQLDEPTVLEASVAEGATDEPEELPFAVKGAKTQTDVDALQVASLPSDWTVQIGQFQSKKSAEAALSKLKKSSAGSLADKKTYTVPITINGATVYSLMMSGFVDEQSAKKSCTLAKKQGRDCSVLNPQG